MGMRKWIAALMALMLLLAAAQAEEGGLVIAWGDGPAEEEAQGEVESVLPEFGDAPIEREGGESGDGDGVPGELTLVERLPLQGVKIGIDPGHQQRGNNGLDDADDRCGPAGFLQVGKPEFISDIKCDKAKCYVRENTDLTDILHGREPQAFDMKPPQGIWSDQQSCDQEARNVRAFKITFSKDTGHHQTRKQSNGYREQHIHNVKPSFFPAFPAALFRCLSAAHTAFCADETVETANRIYIPLYILWFISCPARYSTLFAV
jgi:hypothetical protein